MSAHGTKADGHPGIPSYIFNTVKSKSFFKTAFLSKHARQCCFGTVLFLYLTFFSSGYMKTVCDASLLPKEADFNRSINTMCGNIRRSLGLSKTQEKITLAGVPRKKIAKRKKDTTVSQDASNQVTRH